MLVLQRLNNAAQKGNKDDVIFYLEQGADVNYKGEGLVDYVRTICITVINKIEE